MSELAALAPPAVTVDKPGYSAFTAPALLPPCTAWRPPRLS